MAIKLTMNGAVFEVDTPAEAAEIVLKLWKEKREQEERYDRYNPYNLPFCVARTKAGKQCRRKVFQEGWVCTQHQKALENDE